MSDQPAAPPLVVVEGGAGDLETAAARWQARLEAQGWEVVAGFAVAPGRRCVCAGTVTDERSASAAVLAALRGAGVLIRASADRALLDRLCDDLRRLGPVTHDIAGAEHPGPVLSDQQRALADALLEGLTLGAAAARLHLSRRTADRRLAEIRAAYGVRTTAQALLAHARAMGG